MSASALEFLFGLERLGVKLGLENMRAICAALDHPERTFDSVIVAGTNGKGSVTAMLSAALHAAGHRVGRYTSPHLERLEERFVVNEQEIETAALEASATRIRDVVESLRTQGSLDELPTFFECATAIAFDIFARARVRVAVLEVGLGGRLDATNVVTPVAAAITSIDFDHQAQLGRTLAAIAAEKAGVIKPAVPVVCGLLPPAAAAVVAARCEETGAPLIRIDEHARWSVHLTDAATTVSVRTGEYALADVPLGLEGRHQGENAAIAVCLAGQLVRRGLSVPAEALAAGLATPRWPGRLERFSWRGATVLIDAAHNPAGARALAAYLRDTGWDGVTLVLGTMRDKDAAGILAPLLPLAARVVCTTAPTSRALPAASLAELARDVPGFRGEVAVVEEPRTAVRTAADAGGRVVVAGSIFLIGAVRGILR